jgi:tetratricopeptide (TPR) repeat protein
MRESIPPKWQRVISAADGYLDLGMVSHARSELDELPDIYYECYPALWVRYRLAFVEEQWDLAMHLADSLRRLNPGEPAAWISMAVACRRAQGLREAIALLQEGQVLFKGHPLFPYNLACYYCLLKEYDLARRLLLLAFSMEPGMRDVALRDDDLVDLRDEIKHGRLGEAAE